MRRCKHLHYRLYMWGSFQLLSCSLMLHVECVSVGNLRSQNWHRLHAAAGESSLQNGYSAHGYTQGKLARIRLGYEGSLAWPAYRR